MPVNQRRNAVMLTVLPPSAYVYATKLTPDEPSAALLVDALGCGANNPPTPGGSAP